MHYTNHHHALYCVPYFHNIFVLQKICKILKQKFCKTVGSLIKYDYIFIFHFSCLLIIFIFYSDDSRYLDGYTQLLNKNTFILYCLNCFEYFYQSTKGLTLLS